MASLSDGFHVASLSDGFTVASLSDGFHVASLSDGFNGSLHIRKVTHTHAYIISAETQIQTLAGLVHFHTNQNHFS